MMKKYVLLFVVFIFTTAVCSVGTAASRENIPKKNTSVDIMLSPSATWNIVTENGNNSTKGETSSYNLGLKTDLDKDVSLQYMYSANQSQLTRNMQGLSVFSNQFTMTNQELNVLRKINDNVSVLAGVFFNKTKYVGDDGFGIHSYYAKQKKIAQIGVLLNKQIDDKNNLFGKLAVGKDLNTWKIGLTHAVSKDIDFNVDYSSVRVKNIDMSDTQTNIFTLGDISLKEKLVEVGVTLKF